MTLKEMQGRAFFTGSSKQEDIVAQGHTVGSACGQGSRKLELRSIVCV